MAQNIENILESNEKVVWQGVQNRKVLIFNFVFSLIVLIAISWFLFSLKIINYTSDNGVPGQVSGSLIGTVLLVIGLLVSVLSFFGNLVKNYAITEKRVIIKSGLIGTDFKSVYFDQIKNVIVDVGLIGKIFGTGSIKIDIGKVEVSSSGGGNNGHSSRVTSKTMYDTLVQVDKPYEVYKFVQHSLEERKESLYSGRADKESNPEDYKK